MNQEHDDHEVARRLLAPLASEPTRPSMVDLSRAIVDGRRRVRVRRIAGVGAMAAVAVLVAAGVPAALAAVRAPEGPPVASTTKPTTSPSPSPHPVPTTEPEPAPEPPTSCELELPPVPADVSSSFAFGADPTGRIVYGKYNQPAGTDAASTTPVLWIDGEAVPLDVPGDGPSISAVNSRGWAVGVSLADDNDSTVSWIYRDGEVTELPGEDVWAVAITEDGMVVGARSHRSVPVVWRSPDAPPEDLPDPRYPGEVFTPQILPDGTVVGFRNGIAELDRSFVWWPDGTLQEIPLPEFDGDRLGFEARFLNGHLLIGEARRFRPVEDGGTIRYVAAYDLRTGEYTRLAEGAPFEASALNRHGWVAGQADGRAGLWTPEGGLVELPDLGFHGEWRNNLPQWVSDDGRTIAGEVEMADGVARAAVWRCD